MRNVLPKSALFLSIALATPFAFGRDEAPDAMLNAVTAEVMSILKQDRETAAGMQTKVADLVETKILPLFDFPHMTRIAMARNWRLASTEQQTILMAEFKTLLVRIYSAALSDTRDRVMEFKPMHLSAGNTEVSVKSEATQPGSERMTIDYAMEMTPAGWKVYDVKVRGVSLVATYREIFADTVRDEGIAGLIKSLADKNRQADSGVKPTKATFREQIRIMFAMLQSVLQGHRP
jgi:phospholipid transport system substrate-binding protein